MKFLQKRMRVSAWLMIVSVIVAIGTPASTEGFLLLMPTFNVNSIDDAPDIAPGDGVCDAGGGRCTLRAAIQEVNASTGVTVIDLRPGSYNFLIAGSSEDAAATGDLDITKSVEIRGAGETSTIIDADQLDRVFHLIGDIQVTITGVTIRNGQTPLVEDGGGIWVDKTANLILHDSIIEQNYSGHWGGGIHVDENATALIDDVRFFNNTANSLGGGLDNFKGTVDITESIFRDNFVEDGPGGGIYNSTSGVMTVRMTTIEGNIATSDGGGIYNVKDTADAIGSLSVFDSAIINNEASNGGGIFNFGLLQILQNVTLSNNLAGTNGGGIYNGEDITVINHATIYENEAGSEGGGIYNDVDGEIAIRNSIIANNTFNNCKPINPITSLGYNVESANDCGLGQGIDAVDDLPNTDPQLNSLQDNGGFTFTHQPIESDTSPIIDQAVTGNAPPGIDQRGVSRPQGTAYDIGAHELKVADLAIEKRASSDDVLAADLLTYTVTIENMGQSEATMVVVEDVLDPLTTFVSAAGEFWSCNDAGTSVICTRPILQSGESSEITIVVKAPDDIATVVNRVEVASEITDLDPDNNTAAVSTDVIPVADLDIVKEADLTEVKAGEPLAYTFSVHNAGPSEATDVVVTDTLMAGLVYVPSPPIAGWDCGYDAATHVVTCRYAALPVGDAPPLVINVNAPADPGPIYNTAVVSSAVLDLDETDNSSTIETTGIAYVDLEIVKTANVSNVFARDLFTYTLAVDNYGPSTAENVVITDTLPADVIFVDSVSGAYTCEYNGDNHTVVCTLVTLPAATPTAFIEIMVRATAEGSTINNSVAIASDADEPDFANNTDAQTITVIPLADVVTSQTHAPEPVLASDPITYTILVENFGPSTAENLQVLITLPANGQYLNSLASDWQCDYITNTDIVRCSWQGGFLPDTSSEIAIVVAAPAGTASAVLNANATSTTDDPDDNNNHSNEGVTVLPKSDLSITQSDNLDPVNAGQLYTYTLTMRNDGPSDATDVTLFDKLPASVTYIAADGENWRCTADTNFNELDCTLPSLLVGEETVVTIVIQADEAGGIFTNYAEVDGAPFDQDKSNNTTQETTATSDMANLSMSLTALPNPVDAAALLTYTLSVHNAGPSVATDIVAVYQWPIDAVYQSAGGDGWLCTPNAASREVTCERDTAVVGLSPDITVVVFAPDDGDTIDSLATVDSATFDPEEVSSNVDGEMVTVRPISDLEIVLSDPADVVDAASDYIYDIDVTNNGPSQATALVVSFNMPVGTSVVGDASRDGWTCERINSTITCTRATLDANSSSSIRHVLRAPDEGGDVMASVDVTADTVDNMMSNNSAIETTPIRAIADLSIEKTDLVDPVNAADLITYTVAVTNSGPSSAAGVSVVDTLSPLVTFVAADGNGWTCGYVEASHLIVCDADDTIPVGMSNMIDVVVRAPADRDDVDNTAQVEATTFDPSAANNTAIVNTTVTPVADLLVSIIDQPVTADARQGVTYTISVVNAGPSTADSVALTVTVPDDAIIGLIGGIGWTCVADNAADTVTCLINNLPAGPAPDVIVMTTSPHNAGDVTAVATVTSSTNDLDVTNNTADTDTRIIEVADLSITKTGSEDPVYADHVLTYTLRVNNAGPSDVASVRVVDTLPPEVTFVSAAGTGWLCDYVATGHLVVCVPDGVVLVGTAAPIEIAVITPVDRGFLDNTVRVTSDAVDYNDTNNAATLGTNVTPIADLTVAVTDTPDPVDVGESLIYRIETRNVGPSTAELLVLTHKLPTSVRFDQVVPSPDWECDYNQFTHTVTCLLSALPVGDAPVVNIFVDAAAVDSTVTSETTISASTLDLVASNNRTTNETDVTTTANLRIEKPPQAIQTGATAVYLFHVVNAGPGQALDNSARVILPDVASFLGCPQIACTMLNNEVTFALPDLQPGESVVLAVEVDPNTTAVLEATASTSSSIPDGDLENNEITWLINGYTLFMPLMMTP